MSITTIEQAVLNHLSDPNTNISDRQYIKEQDIIGANIIIQEDPRESDEDLKTKLSSEQIIQALSGLRSKGYIQYTGAHDELIFVFHSKLPQS